MENLQSYINVCGQSSPAKSSLHYLGKTRALLPHPTLALEVTTMLHRCLRCLPKIRRRQHRKKQALIAAFLAMDIPVQLQDHRTVLQELLAKPRGKRYSYIVKTSVSP